MEPQVRLQPPRPSIFSILIESGVLPFYFGKMLIQCAIVYCYGDLLTPLLPWRRYSAFFNFSAVKICYQGSLCGSMSLWLQICSFARIFTMLFAKALGIIWYKSVYTVFRLFLDC